MSSYLRAAAEAGMVGGLADWLVVTALLRRPLGLPIPHTVLIPTRNAQLGASATVARGRRVQRVSADAAVRGARLAVTVRRGRAVTATGES